MYENTLYNNVMNSYTKAISVQRLWLVFTSVTEARKMLN